ncbi:AAA family ATPase [Promicromonospora sukumoe]|uniref:helix-turn-helix transcriptional regulator n=1 Tax=Promicromonospora sukumoe TaxID=88382 RepID=UPI00365AF667
MSGWSASEFRRWNEAAQSCFVGRRAERAQLQDAWAAARGGSRQVRFVAGEPGAGKSRLLAQLAADLGSDDATVLAGTCPSTLGSPYEPFVAPVAAMRTAIADGALPLDGAAQSGSPQPGSSQARHPPDAQAVAGTVAFLDTVAGERPAGRASRRDLLDAVVASVRSAAAVEPLVLLLDDVHWAGETAWELLSHLVEQTAGLPLLLVAAQRSTATDRPDHLVRHVAALYRLDGVRRIDLPPLAAEDVEEYLVQEAKVPEELARAVAADVHGRTGGNAYFMRELVQTLGARGPAGFVRPDGPTPPSVQDAVEARLGLLAPGARPTVELAAVIGDVVHTDLLVTTGAAPPEEALGHLDAALDAHLLEPVDEMVTAVRFRHAIAREVVLGAIPSARRTALHLRVARALEARGARSAADVARVAHHFEAAHLLGYRAEAVRYLRLAAVLAAEGLAHDEAADLYERAAAVDDDRTRADDAVLLAARQRMLAGAVVRSRVLAEPIADDAASPHRLRAAVQYEDANWRTNVDAGRSVALLRAALGPADDGAAGHHDPGDLRARGPRARDPGAHDEQLQVRALAGLGRALAFDGHDQQGRELIDDSIARARTLGGEDLLADVLVASLVQGSSVTDAEAKLGRAVELSELCLRTHDLWRLGPAASYRTLLGYQRGDAAVVRAGLADLRLAVEGTEQRYFGYLAGCVDFSQHLAAGRLAQAARLSERLLEIGDAVELDAHVRTDGQFGVQQFVVRRESGGLEDVRGLVTGDEDLGERWAPGLLALYTELGMRDAARRALWWLIESRAIESLPGTRVGVLTFLSDAAVALGDAEAGRLVRDALAPYRGLNIMFGSLVSAMGSADRYLGSLDALLGTGDWEADFARAEEMDRRMGARLHVAHTLAAHALAHARTGADGWCDVGALAAEARSIATTVGSQRVLRMLDGVGGIDHGPARRPAGLTEREVEVLRLVAQGLSNREIARSLVISGNTAANHVRSILLKTGCENRTRAARYAATHDLLD